EVKIPLPRKNSFQDEIYCLNGVIFERWNLDGYHTKNLPYENSFQRLFSKLRERWTPTFFLDLLREMKSRGESTNVADLMGSGLFLQDPSLADSIFGFREHKLIYEPGEIDQ